MSKIEERARLLMNQIWPGGVPHADQMIWDALPKMERAPTLKRLEAVWRAGRGELLAPLAEMAGLRRAAFTNLRGSWQRESLAGIVPHETRRGRGLSPHNQALQERAALLIRAAPLHSRNVEIASKLIADENKTSLLPIQGRHIRRSQLQQAERIVRHERRALARSAAFLRDCYGRRLLVDLTAVNLGIKGRQTVFAVAAIVVEVASMAILGSAIGKPGERLHLLTNAVRSALMSMEEVHMGQQNEDDVSCDLTLALPSDIEPDSRQVEALQSAVHQLTMVAAGGRAKYQSVTQLIGSRIGRTSLLPRRSLLSSVDDLPSGTAFQILPESHVRAHWFREVARHNSFQTPALVEAGLFARGHRLSDQTRSVLSSLADLLADLSY